MEGLDAQQARDHLAMVDRILAESSQRLRFGAEYFLVWGLYSGICTLILHLVAIHTLPASALVAVAALLVASIGFSIWRGFAKSRETLRRSIVQREYFNVLWLTIGLAFVANVGAYNIFDGLASAAIWSFGAAIVLLFIGMHGSRRAQVAGVLVVVSLIVANFVPHSQAAYVLAAGMVVGYGGFGLLELLARE